jgi:hypothetical protein
MARKIRASQVMKMAEIPVWAIDERTPDRYTVAAAFALAGFEGQWVRLTADSQRAVFGHNLFGKCKLMVDENGIMSVRSVCFGTDWSGVTLDWNGVERCMATGEGPGF